MNITLIPAVMRSLRWNNAARLMDRWFARLGNADPARGVPDTTTIRMDQWVLTFPRAAEIYNQLVTDRIWANEAAQPVVARMLQRQGKFTSQRTTFGNLSAPVPQLDIDFINQRSAGAMTDPLDDMYGALGRFLFRTVIQGFVTPAAASMHGTMRSPTGRPTPGFYRHTVNIERVGIYVWDSYDFNGHQLLGFWSPLGVSKVPLPGFDLVTNGDFRDHRARTGYGHDYIIYSDLKVLVRNPPDSFVAPLSAETPPS